MGATCRAAAAGNLGKYTLYEKLGEGYLGTVYRAFDPDLGHDVALRIVSDGIRWDAGVEACLDQECQAAAGLKHPNIAGLFAVGTEGPSHYVVSELLDSRNLETLIAQKSAMPWEAKVSIMIKAAEGLSHAHGNGVLHRDLRPAKIHLGSDGNVKIRDFGIAHVLMKYLSHPGVRWGAPIYMSPEQVQLKDCDARSDMFSAGIIFYELFTFSHPFHDRNSNKTLDNILFSTELPTFDQFPQVPPGIWTILKMCLAKDPQERYGSMDEFSSACRGFLKDLAEESQLMLSELHAALPRLRKAALQPDASESMVALLHEVQRLSLSEEYADYASLDRLMTSLIDHYPKIQAVPGPPPIPELLAPSARSDEPSTQAAAPAENALPSPAAPGETTGTLHPAQSAETAPDQKVEFPGHDDEAQQADPARKSPPSETVIPERALGERQGAYDKAGQTQAELGRSPAAPSVTPEAERAPVPHPEAAAAPAPAGQKTAVPPESRAGTHPASLYRSRKISRPAYRTAAALLSLLLMAVAVYIIRGTSTSLRTAWSTYLPGWPASASGPDAQGTAAPPPPDTAPVQAADPVTVRILHKEAQVLAGQRRYDECKVLLRRILEIDPANEDAVATLNYIEAASSAPGAETNADTLLRKDLARVSLLISSGRLQAAGVELEKLERSRPDAPGVASLRRRLESRNSKMMGELTRKEEEQKEAARVRREEDWNRSLAELFAQGRYAEARGALYLWLAEDPESPRAQEAHQKVEEIQRGLKTCESAFEERRYQDALAALAGVERLNPGDPSLAEWRRRIESRKAAARATLTVYRLSDKATLLFDGKPIGTGGELENESIPIGSHTLAVENSIGFGVTTSQEFLEGQKAVYVYDIAKQQLRPMTELDREYLLRKKASEQVHRFAVEHYHGRFRGSCKGELLVNPIEVEFRPASGTHGFRIPSRSLKLRAEGKSLDFSFASDDKDFQSFRLQDAQTAESIKKTWDTLASGKR